jgi:hypothetical protein
MKNIYVVFVGLLLLCSSQIYATCDAGDCEPITCQEGQLNVLDDGMLDFCDSPSFGVYSIEKDGITWKFNESVTYGKYVNGDYWVLDTGDGIVIKEVFPAPNDGFNGSMVNPNVGSQAYDKYIDAYDENLAVKFPVTLHAGDSLVSTISVTDKDLNAYGKISPSWYTYSQGLSASHSRLMNASVLTVVSKVPKYGEFRPPYVGNTKKSYNVRNINWSILPKRKAPSSLPDVEYYERGVERPWLMHIYHYSNRKMHPVENMPNYHREVGTFLSDVSLILLTDGATRKLLYGFIQTGIDHYHTIINGAADNSTFEFHSIFTGLLLADQEMMNVWVSGQSKTLGRGFEKFYFPDQKLSTISSSIVKGEKSWTGYDVMFRKKRGDAEHEHLHPSEWEKVVNGGGIKQETYRLCCDSKPHFGMVLASRVLKAGKYWPNNALDVYMDRWVSESKYDPGLKVIKEYYPDFAHGKRNYILGSKFVDAMYEKYKSTVGMSSSPENTLSNPVTRQQKIQQWKQQRQLRKN